MKAIFFSLLLFVISTINSQNIEGVWQINTPVVGSTLDQCYQFNENEEFNYHPSGYDGLSRITAIGGKYQIKKDTMYFIVKCVEESIGGTIERSTITTLNDSWAIISDDYEIKRRFFLGSEVWAVPFKMIDNEKIQIGNNTYFLTQEEINLMPITPPQD